MCENFTKLTKLAVANSRKCDAMVSGLSSYPPNVFGKPKEKFQLKNYLVFYIYEIKKIVGNIKLGYRLSRRWLLILNKILQELISLILPAFG